MILINPGYHLNIVQCMQSKFLLNDQVCPMLMVSVPHSRGIFFKLIVNFSLKGVVFMFWNDIVYIKLLYCVTNFEVVWT